MRETAAKDNFENEPPRRRAPRLGVAPRSRSGLLGTAILVLAAGWSARTGSAALPFLLGTYGPDTLWALLVFLVALILRPDCPTRRAFWVALWLSYSIEISQLYQAPWLNHIRDTKIGGLLLGHGFLWSDLVCYTAGIALGAAIDARLIDRACKRAATGRGC